MKKNALVWCSRNTPDEERVKGALIDTFKHDDTPWEVIYPEADGFQDSIDRYASFVISGSPNSVVQDAKLPLVSNLLSLLRAIATDGKTPVVGVCFGAQAIAAALGGEVGTNPGGKFRIGVEELTWTGGTDGLGDLNATGSAATVVQSHGECVTKLPPGAVHLAESRATANEAFRVGDQFLGIQGHPEADRSILTENFMPFLKDLISEDDWQNAKVESERKIAPQALIEFARNFLEQGKKA